MYPGAAPAQYNTSAGAYVVAPNSSITVEIGSQNYDVPFAGSWGAPYPNDQLQWLPMYACNLLENDASASSPWLSWGLAFNGLHSVLAFDTEAADSNPFVSDFVLGFLGFQILFITFEPQTIVQSWLERRQRDGHWNGGGHGRLASPSASVTTLTTTGAEALWDPPSLGT